MNYPRIFASISLITLIIYAFLLFGYPQFLSDPISLAFVVVFGMTTLSVFWSAIEEDFFKKFFNSIIVEILIAAFIVTVIFLLYTRFIFYNYPRETDWSIRGQFGDMFGGLNVVFSSLVFIVAYASWRIQSKELIESKKSSELNTKISALQSFISSFPENVVNEQKMVAQSILHQLTKNYFSEPSHKEILEPKIDISHKKPSWKNYIYYPEIIFTNNGHSVKVLLTCSEHLNITEFSLEQNKSITLEYQDLPLDIRDANKRVILYFTYSSLIATHEWKEKVVINYIKQTSRIERSCLL